METPFELLYNELQKFTRATCANCETVATHLAEEVDRICNESPRIQSSGDATTWRITLGRHRLNQCLKYYRMGSRCGRLELHSTLSAMVYRHISRPGGRSGYQERVILIEDFLQSFYIETLNAFRREFELVATYQPRTLLELAEYMAFTERYAKRRIALPRGRTQQLIILRAKTFSQQQPQDTLVDIEQAAESRSLEDLNSRNIAPMQQVREKMMTQESEPLEGALRQKVAQELLKYLEEREQHDCVNYFILRLQDISAKDIETILGLTTRQRDYLQQRFKYHLTRFALNHRWELVHEWLGADLQVDLGLLPQQWHNFHAQLNPKQTELLEMKQNNQNDLEIAQTLDYTIAQMQRQWSKLLQRAWELRNMPALQCHTQTATEEEVG